MKIKEFRGVIPPVLTLFDEMGEINESAQRGLVDFLVDSGVHGFFVGGSFGSGPIMSVEQRKRLAEIVMDQVHGRIPCIIHVGSSNTHDTVQLAKHAEKLGADAIAAVPPYYYKHTNKNILSYYETLVKSIEKPVFIYNNPGTSGVFITLDMVVKLGRMGVKGMKDSCMNIASFYTMKDKMVKEGLDFQFIIGTDALWLPALLVGARAMISGLANIFPEFIVDFYNKTINGGAQSAVELQNKVLRIRDIVKMETIPIPTFQAILQLRGLKGGKPKPPFQSLDSSYEKLIRDALEKEGMLKNIY